MTKKNPSKKGHDEIDSYIVQNQHLSYGEIAEGLNMREDAVRKRYRKLNLPHKRKGKHETGENLKKSFQKFLIKGRTMKEIKSVYGEKSSELLKKKFEGLNLFHQLNRSNETVYILLPEIDNKIKLQKRKWAYHVGKNEEGGKQPYICCQLPNFKGNIEIALLFDVHYGHSAHNHKKWLSYLRWIEETPNVYAVVGGDLMENALDDGRGMSYDQEKNPHTQLEDMVRTLAPIAHKVLLATPGNHEQRTYNKTGIDVMQVLADRLDIPYFSGPVFLTILANGYRWRAHVFHGRGNSQTKGGKMNSATRPARFTEEVHFLVSGHVHDRVAEDETMIVEDPVNMRLRYVSRWTVIAPSFLGWEETYAYRAGYPPPAKGGVAIELSDNGDYRAYLT